MPGKPDAARRLEIEDRRRQVAVLTVAHQSQREIARMLGVSSATIANDVAKVKEDWRRRAAVEIEAHIAEELAKLDTLERRWLPRAFDDKDAFDRVMKIFERRARLLGLDRPTKIDADVRVHMRSELDAEIESLLAQIGG